MAAEPRGGSGRPPRRRKKKVLETPKYHHRLGISRKSHSGYSSPRDHTFVPSSLRTSPVPNKRGASFGGISLSFFSNKHTHTHTHKREKRAQQRGIREPLSRARVVFFLSFFPRARVGERERERERKKKKNVWGNCEKCLFFSKIQRKREKKGKKKPHKAREKFFWFSKRRRRKHTRAHAHTKEQLARALARARCVCVSVCLSVCVCSGRFSARPLKRTPYYSFFFIQKAAFFGLFRFSRERFFDFFSIFSIQKASYRIG